MTKAEMLRGFFATLADTLDEQLPTTKEKVGRVLRIYGALLKPVPVAGSALEGVAGALGAAWSENNLAKERQRVEALLAEHATRVVILIDDLDRLDKAEIQGMFRLVKVAADFAHTAYVLAFDHAVVASALAERYAAGSDYGAGFMDKIIQLPLHLPPIPPELLRRLSLEAVDVALNQAEVELTEADVSAFVSAFDRTVAPRLATPRAAKLPGYRTEQPGREVGGHAAWSRCPLPRGFAPRLRRPLPQRPHGPPGCRRAGGHGRSPSRCRCSMTPTADRAGRSAERPARSASVGQAAAAAGASVVTAGCSAGAVGSA
ncbi:MAG: KAP family P-loop NTPase fold protein [Blastococcus sp.]